MASKTPKVRRISAKDTLLTLANSRVADVIVVGYRAGELFIVQSGTVAPNKAADYAKAIDQLERAVKTLREQQSLVGS